MASVAGGLQLLTIALFALGAIGFAAARIALSDGTRAWWFAIVSLVVGSLAVGAAMGMTMGRATSRTLAPVLELVRAARSIATTGSAPIPFTDRADEVGELARGLQAWQEAGAERELMLQSAPVGVSRLDAAGEVETANPALVALLGDSGSREWLPFLAYAHPLDRVRLAEALRRLVDSGLDRVDVECRLRRADGTFLWCATTLAPLKGAGELPEGFIAIVSDISEHKRDLERAARIQGELLPKAMPDLSGYQLVATCLPAEDVAGDFYDWTVSDDGRRLRLTVADVMGHGVASALVMATVRAVLRATAAELGLAAALSMASDFIAFGSQEAGLFVTMFHSELDLASGTLRYVDAGHGHCAVRRAGGELERLGERSLPLGVLQEEGFAEGSLVLRPGDSLIVCSDGLVEHDDRTGSLADHARDLDDATDAGDMMRRLMRDLPAQPSDDVTVVVLRRRAGPAAAPADSSPVAVAAAATSGPTARASSPAASPAGEPAEAGTGAAQIRPDSGGPPGRRAVVPPRESVNRASVVGVVRGISLHILVVVVAALLLGHAAASAATSDAVRVSVIAAAFFALGSVLLGAIVAVSISSDEALGGGLRFINHLAGAAREITRTGHADIPHMDVANEFGELARSLGAWQRASAEREVMVEQAPVGICRLDEQGSMTGANPALLAMHGVEDPSTLMGSFLEYVLPEDRERHTANFRGLAEGVVERLEMETRYRRAGGGIGWCSVVVSSRPAGGGQHPGFVAIVQDITARMQQAERAARIQRELLPRAAPELTGYELAADCRVARVAAGDLYDWRLSPDGSRLELTVADVTGRGTAAALIMATLRAVLRTAPQRVGLPERVRLAADMMPFGGEEAGMFATLFQGELDLDSGVLRYVDAGHGCAAIRRPGGELRRLDERSLPLGVLARERFTEGTVRLRPGESLIVYTDGLVQRGDGVEAEVDWHADGARTAGDIVGRLMRHVPAEPADDAVVLALRRAPATGRK